MSAAVKRGGFVRGQQAQGHTILEPNRIVTQEAVIHVRIDDEQVRLCFVKDVADFDERVPHVAWTDEGAVTGAL
jgi:hypothetical protein